MANHEELFQETLRERGFRVTPDRLHVYRLLESSPFPLPISTVVEEIQSTGINQTTVYRILELFTAIGIVHPVLIGHGSVGYELIPPFRHHHHHLVCVGCNQVVDLNNCRLEQRVDEIVEPYGYKILYHDLEIHGLCPDCQAKEKDNAPNEN
ncbi:Fur family transcriptional regulator, ferric uptake regulator [Sulfobacillus thermosulfidooxidans DSM 9293]|uniref:Fur family transcriptional regulator, ferric uptake regulator n=1 Tax=Sulfobacillus thermosulfidooxidans (strain DSM 9293 / VKM B-1269 / AT-1) TaxID=929705 RepID=A0A1W1WG23_SULTA|nr:Fur family transcriptional regulator [Sulfobacillus thermosulfidooxidans]SMC05142.1 Fur family transcriptional regulator, ferric uptake regulator [Sulfobacillus thermosulfidooxidans DSM 9293]